MKHYIIFLLSLCFIACGKVGDSISNIDTSQIEEIIINTEHRSPWSPYEKEAFKAEDSLFSEDVFFVKLETTDESLIANISDIFFDDSLIFVVDTKMKSVFIFDFEGNYINKIAAFGAGPCEYGTLYNVFLDRKNKYVVIVDTPRGKIYSYSYDGKCVREERKNKPFINCQFLASGNRAYHLDRPFPQYDHQNGNSLVVTTPDNQKTIYSACYQFQRNEKFYFGQQKVFWDYGGNLFYYPNYSDTIFIITDTAAIAKYHIRILPEAMPHPSEIADVTNDIFFDNYLTKYPHFDCEFIETKDFTYLELDNFYGKIIYSHKTKKTYQIWFTITGNRIYDFMQYSEPHPITVFNDNTLVFSVEAYNIVDNKKYHYRPRNPDPDWHDIPIRHSFLDSLYHNMTEEDNPVLFFYTLNTEE